MLDQILGMVKDQIGGQITEKFNLNDNQAGEAVEIGGSSIKDVLMKQISSGNPDSIRGLLKGNDTAGLSGIIGGDFAGKLVSKLGVSGGVADSIKDFILPQLIKAVSSKLGGNFDVSSITSLLGGGMTSGIMDAAKDKLGGLGKLF